MNNISAVSGDLPTSWVGDLHAPQPTSFRPRKVGCSTGTQGFNLSNQTVLRQLRRHLTDLETVGVNLDGPMSDRVVKPWAPRPSPGI